VIKKFIKILNQWPLKSIDSVKRIQCNVLCILFKAGTNGMKGPATEPNPMGWPQERNKIRWIEMQNKALERQKQRQWQWQNINSNCNIELRVWNEEFQPIKCCILFHLSFNSIKLIDIEADGVNWDWNEEIGMKMMRMEIMKLENQWESRKLRK